MLDGLADGLALVDEDGVIRFANSRLSALSGLDLTQVVGRSVEDLMPSPTRSMRDTHRRSFVGVPCVRELDKGLHLDPSCRDGPPLVIDIGGSPVLVDGASWTAALIRDESER